MDSVRHIDLQDPQDCYNVWIGQAESLMKVPGRLDRVVLFMHDKNTPANAWRMSVAPDNSYDQFIPGLISALYRYCEANGIPVPKPGEEPEVEEQPRPRAEQPPSSDGRRTVKIPLPPGTTESQAKAVVEQLNGAIGGKPRIKPT